MCCAHYCKKSTNYKNPQSQQRAPAFWTKISQRCFYYPYIYKVKFSRFKTALSFFVAVQIYKEIHFCKQKNLHIFKMLFKHLKNASKVMSNSTIFGNFFENFCKLTRSWFRADNTMHHRFVTCYIFLSPWWGIIYDVIIHMWFSPNILNRHMIVRNRIRVKPVDVNKYKAVICLLSLPLYTHEKTDVVC